MAMSWKRMSTQPRVRVADVTEYSISDKPGVYALYRAGEPVYVGKAAVLRSRLWRNHLRRGVSMTDSALRRNVAHHLAIASAADIKARRYKPTLEDAARVSDWIRECDVAWIECESEADALMLEASLKAEFKPPLTKI